MRSVVNDLEMNESINSNKGVELRYVFSSGSDIRSIDVRSTRIATMTITGKVARSRGDRRRISERAVIKVKARELFSNKIASPHSFGFASHVYVISYFRNSSPYNRASAIIASAILSEIDSHVIVRAQPPR